MDNGFAHGLLSRRENACWWRTRQQRRTLELAVAGKPAGSPRSSHGTTLFL